MEDYKKYIFEKYSDEITEKIHELNQAIYIAMIAQVDPVAADKFARQSVSKSLYPYVYRDGKEIGTPDQYVYRLLKNEVNVGVDIRKIIKEQIPGLLVPTISEDPEYYKEKSK